MTSSEIILENAISKWATSKKANVSLDSYRYELERWTNLVGEKSVNHIVDIGSGSGLFGISAIVLGYADQVTSIDPMKKSHGTQPSEVKQTQELATDLGLSDQVSFIRGFWPNVPVPRCDLIVFRLSLHHIIEEGMTREGLVENLKDTQNDMDRNGHIYIKESSPSYGAQWGIQQLYRWLRGKSLLSKQGKISLEDWKSILHESEFVNIRAVKLAPNMFINSRFPNSHTRFLSNSFLVTGRSSK